MAEYYQYRDVLIRFDVFKDGRDVTPTDASVEVYDPDEKFVGRDVARVDGSEVSYVLEGGKVEKIGEYIFVFEVGIRQLGDYTHVVNAPVKEFPVKTEITEIGE